MKTKIEFLNWIHSLLLSKYRLVKFEINSYGVSYFFGNSDYMAFYNISNESIEYHRLKNRIPLSLQKIIK
jgi:hypothetical protein